MTVTTIATMIVILGFVWGGLALIVTTAVRKERGKRGSGPTEAS